VSAEADLDRLTAFDYARLKAEVRRQYASGDVVVYDGWILSSAEYRMFVAKTPSLEEEAARL
jgi:hypothetical protein